MTTELAEPVEQVETFTKHASLDEALYAAMSEIGYIQRSQPKGLSYRVITESDVIALIRPALMKNRLILKPVRMKPKNTATIEKASSKGTSIIRFAQVRYKWKLSHIDSKEYEFVETGGEAMDYGDKALPKALTIATKYLLRHLFLLETGDDPDTTASEAYSDKPDSGKQSPKTPPKPTGNKLFPSVCAGLRQVTDLATLEKYYKAAKERPLTKVEFEKVTEIYNGRKSELTPPEEGPESPEPPDQPEAY